MIYTTYFAQLRNLPSNMIPVSICGKAPEWYKGIQYKRLAPKYGFFMEWKKTHNNDYYVEHFSTEVLDSLSVMMVLTELQCAIPDEIKEQMQSPFYTNPDWHIALICYEKPEDFCHRHLVSQWFCDSGFECKEWVIGHQLRK